MHGFKGWLVVCGGLEGKEKENRTREAWRLDLGTFQSWERKLPDLNLTDACTTRVAW